MNTLEAQIERLQTNNDMSRCAALREVASRWTGYRADFIRCAKEAGIPQGTASRQWTEGRNGRGLMEMVK